MNRPIMPKLALSFTQQYHDDAGAQSNKKYCTCFPFNRHTTNELLRYDTHSFYYPPIVYVSYVYLLPIAAQKQHKHHCDYCRRNGTTDKEIVELFRCVIGGIQTRSTVVQ